MSEQNRPEDSPKPITQTPVPHSGETVKREFDLPLDQANEQNKLFVPDTIGQPIDLSGAPYMPFTERDEQEASEKVIASYQPGTPEKKKMSPKAKLAWFGAGILTVGGLIGIGANAAAEGPFMKAPTATAPANPNQGGVPLPAAPGETNPAVTQTPGENITYVPVTEADIQDYAAIAANARINYGEYRAGARTLPVFVEKFNEMLNIRFPEDEITNSKNLVSKSGATGPHALLEMKLTAYDDLFQGNGGAIKAALVKESKETFDKWLATRNEEHPFEVAFVKTESSNTLEYAYTSNSTQNSIADWPNPPRVYKFVAGDPVLGPLKNGEQKSDQPWQFSSAGKLVESK